MGSKPTEKEATIRQAGKSKLSQTALIHIILNFM